MQDPGDLTVGQTLTIGKEVGIAPDSILLGLAEERLPEGAGYRAPQSHAGTMLRPGP